MNEYIIAKYIRLSIEDEKTESMSIPNQRHLLDRHIDELDIPNMVVLEFVDNGHSGTNIANAAYRCHHTLADPNAECHKLKVSAAELDETALTIIRKQAEVVLNFGNLSELRLMSADSKRIADYEKEIRLCIEQRQLAYERFVLREIDNETF